MPVTGPALDSGRAGSGWICRALLLAAAAAASAAPSACAIDPTHTFPGFEVDPMGISVWRGTLNQTSDKVLDDKAAGTEPTLHGVSSGAMVVRCSSTARRSRSR
jgi:hypothetical protein